ncbi:hypothetical protein FHW17_003740 [Phyllobacterium sp. P30BS-XVII]|nr:hypothetical protein [Phyllobacterium sp. P30BS-XVII]
MGCKTIVAPFDKLRMREREGCRSQVLHLLRCDLYGWPCITQLPHGEPVEPRKMVIASPNIVVGKYTFPITTPAFASGY